MSALTAGCCSRIVTAGETNIVNVFKDFNDDDPLAIDDNKERINAIAIQVRLQCVTNPSRCPIVAKRPL